MCTDFPAANACVELAFAVGRATGGVFGRRRRRRRWWLRSLSSSRPKQSTKVALYSVPTSCSTQLPSHNPTIASSPRGLAKVASHTFDPEERRAHLLLAVRLRRPLISVVLVLLRPASALLDVCRRSIERALVAAVSAERRRSRLRGVLIGGGEGDGLALRGALHLQACWYGMKGGCELASCGVGPGWLEEGCLGRFEG